MFHTPQKYIKPSFVIPSTEALSASIQPIVSEFLFKNYQSQEECVDLCTWAIAKALEDIYLFCVSPKQRYRWFYTDFYEQNKNSISDMVTTVLPIGIFASRPYCEVLVGGYYGNFHIRID